MANQGAGKMAALFEKKMQDATQPQTNAKHKKEVVWTPTHDSTGVGAHTSEGYAKQRASALGTGKNATPKRSLADLP